MTRRTLLLILCGLLVLLGVAALAVFKTTFLFSFFSGPHVILYDGHVFQPQTLTINVGDTVTFKNISNEDFWPASNLHPSHLLYPEFDPKQPIAAGKSWSFTFTKVGDWGFHNHIKPTVVGTIKVLDTNGKEKKLDCSLQQNQAQCWEDDIQNALNSGGVDAAFTVFSKLYDNDPSFASACHGYAHLIGQKSYDQFINKESFALTPKMQLCGYGFFHGFMETLLIRSGDITLAQDFCRYVNDKLGAEIPSAMNACYHGIGHGAVDGGDPRDWGDAYKLIQPGLAMCDKVGDTDFHKYLCGTGVFNGIAIAFQNGDYNLKPDKDHVFDLCERMESPLYKRACYQQINTLVFFLAHNDPKTAIGMVVTQMKDDAYMQDALAGVTGMFQHYNMTQAEYDNVTKLCNALKKPERGYCFTGFVTSSVEYGTLGEEYQPAFNYCKTADLAAEDRSACFATVALNTSFIFSAEKMKKVCDLVGAETDITQVPICNGKAPASVF